MYACVLNNNKVRSQSQDIHSFADALLFSITNMTTAGLVDPKSNHDSLVLVTLSLLVGVPLNTVFWGEVNNTWFAKYLSQLEEASMAKVGFPSHSLDDGCALSAQDFHASPSGSGQGT